MNCKHAHRCAGTLPVLAESPSLRGDSAGRRAPRCDAPLMVASPAQHSPSHPEAAAPGSWHQAADPGTT